jgi:hypothetical protein
MKAVTHLIPLPAETDVGKGAAAQPSIDPVGDNPLVGTTELAGAGNVMPYGVLQVYAVVVVVLIAWAYPSRYTRGRDIYWVFAAYVIAKLLETFDKELLAHGNLVSGHSLKHLAAAAAGLIVCRMLLLRTLNEPADTGTTPDR